MGRAPNHTFKDKLEPKGQLELFVTRGRPNLLLHNHVSNPHNLPIYRDHRIDFTDSPLISKQVMKNIIVNQGKDKVIESLTTGFILTLARISVGDRGAIPSDPTIPKTPLPTMSALYNEVYRADAEGIILNVGTPTVHEVKLVRIFSAAEVAITAFSNQAKPVLNEVGLIMVDLAQPPPLPRPPITGPYFYPTPLPVPPNLYPYPWPPVSPYNYPPPDETLFAIRTHKSVPFEVAYDIAVTIRYTIFIE